MALVCVVTLEMVSPDCPHLERWRRQYEHEDTLSPEPEGGEFRRWRGSPESRDWDRLEAYKKRQGWRTLSLRRDFVERSDVQEKRDSVELAA